MKEPVILLYSGGYDSFIAALKLKKENYNVTLFFIDYGQVSSVESIYAEFSAKFLNLCLIKTNITGVFKYDKDSLLLYGKTVFGLNEELCNRNLVFLTVVCNYAISHKINKIAIAVDGFESSYKDASRNFIALVENVFKISANPDIEILLPVANYEKWQLMEYADLNGVLKESFEYTFSCLLNGSKKHDWGVGCGDCVSCKAREINFNFYNQSKKGLCIEGIVFDNISIVDINKLKHNYFWVFDKFVYIAELYIGLIKFDDKKFRKIKNELELIQPIFISTIFDVWESPLKFISVIYPRIINKNVIKGFIYVRDNVVYDMSYSDSLIKKQTVLFTKDSTTAEIISSINNYNAKNF
jgi:7-cyano-7-deazaguanine synthase